MIFITFPDWRDNASLLREIEVKEKTKVPPKISLLRDKSLHPFGEHSFGYFFGHKYTDGCINSQLY